MINEQMQAQVVTTGIMVEVDDRYGALNVVTGKAIDVAPSTLVVPHHDGYVRVRNGTNVYQGVFWNDLNSYEQEEAVLRYYVQCGGVNLHPIRTWRHLSDKGNSYPGWPQLRQAAELAEYCKYSVVLGNSFHDSVSRKALKMASELGYNIDPLLVERNLAVTTLIDLITHSDPRAIITEGNRPNFEQYVIHVAPKDRNLRHKIAHSLLDLGFVFSSIFRDEILGDATPFWVQPEQVNFDMFPHLKR